MEKKPKTAVPTPVSVRPDMMRLVDEIGPEGILLGTHCKSCGAKTAGKNRHCRNCTSSEVETIELSSGGILINYTIVHRAAPTWTGQVPYILGEVELPEHVVVTSEVVDVRPDEIEEGMQVKLSFRVGGHTKSGDPIVVYKWTPA